MIDYNLDTFDKTILNHEMSNATIYKCKSIKHKNKLKILNPSSVVLDNLRISYTSYVLPLDTPLCDLPEYLKYIDKIKFFALGEEIWVDEYSGPTIVSKDIYTEDLGDGYGRVHVIEYE